MYRVITVVAPVVEPVSLLEAKAQLRIESTFTDDDTFISSLISSARDRVERFCQRPFTAKTVDIVYEGSFPEGDVEFPFPDVSSISAISYRDHDSATQTVSLLDVIFDPNSRTVANNNGWPTGAKNYTFRVLTSVPSEMNSVKAAILMIVADMYELRTESVTGTIISDNAAVSMLLQPYREGMSV